MTTIERDVLVSGARRPAVLAGIRARRHWNLVESVDDLSQVGLLGVLEAVEIIEAEARGIRFRRGPGCRACRVRGYLGRIGLFEVLTLNDELPLLLTYKYRESIDMAAATGVEPTRMEPAVLLLT